MERERERKSLGSSSISEANLPHLVESNSFDRWCSSRMFENLVPLFKLASLVMWLCPPFYFPHFSGIFAYLCKFVALSFFSIFVRVRNSKVKMTEARGLDVDVDCPHTAF